jgi:tRNA modification GTPase
LNQFTKKYPEKILSEPKETIAAISTPIGESGIGIIRISGSLAEPIIRQIFRPKRDQFPLISHQFHYGEIIDPKKGHPIDEALVVLMKGPKTYTREDIVEIDCHGGYLILQKVLELVLSQGARMAHPGEFTKRAFLNGRIDLTQAEAVIDLIRAKTSEGIDIANQQLKGFLYKEMNGLKESLLGHLSLIEAHIDFPEEEIDTIHQSGMKQDILDSVQKLDKWISTYEEGRVIREGISCAIIGKTNVGKSSLLNVLLKQERAIVTPIPGTTRDVIEEVLNIHGIPVRLMDTAGLRKTVDSVEQEGVKRTKEKVEDSDLILLILDGSRELDRDDLEIFLEIKGKKKVIIVNKKDLPQKISMEELKIRFSMDPIISISALKQEGIEDLKKIIHSTLIHGEIRISPEHLIVANIRHKTLLAQIKENLSNTVKSLEDGTPLEFIAFEIRSALDCLGEMVGETTTEEVLNRIFAQFCIGK